MSDAYPYGCDTSGHRAHHVRDEWFQCRVCGQWFIRDHDEGLIPSQNGPLTVVPDEGADD